MLVAVIDSRTMKARTSIHGVGVTERAQCKHYRSDRDVVAIRFKCCDTFYACVDCHDQLAGHAAVVWSKGERDMPAIFCGACHGMFSIAQYLGCENKCPKCRAGFNPACANHYHLYFEL